VFLVSQQVDQLERLQVLQLLQPWQPWMDQQKWPQVVQWK
jgi:hypothetical protein